MSDGADRCRLWIGLAYLAVAVASYAPFVVSSCDSFAVQRLVSPGVRPDDLCRPWLIWRPSLESPPVNLGILWALTLAWFAAPRIKRWRRRARVVVADGASHVRGFSQRRTLGP